MDIDDRNALLEVMEHFADGVFDDMMRELAMEKDGRKNWPEFSRYTQYKKRFSPKFEVSKQKLLKDWMEYFDTVQDDEAESPFVEDEDGGADTINHSNPYAEYLEIKKGELRPDAAEWVRYKNGSRNINYGKYLQFVKTVSLSGIDESLAAIADYLERKGGGDIEEN